MSTEPFKNNTRSSDFRVVYANAFGVQFNGQDLLLRFGIQRDLTNPDAGNEDQVAVAMSVVAMKTLVYSLGNIVESFEKTTGTTIPLNPVSVQALETAIKESGERLRKTQGKDKT